MGAEISPAGNRAFRPPENGLGTLLGTPRHWGHSEGTARLGFVHAKLCVLAFKNVACGQAFKWHGEQTDVALGT